MEATVCTPGIQDQPLAPGPLGETVRVIKQSCVNPVPCGRSVSNHAMNNESSFQLFPLHKPGSESESTAIVPRGVAPPRGDVTESPTKGDQVIVTGRLRQRSFETSNRDKRTLIELEVDDIGPFLRYATAKAVQIHPSRGRCCCQRRRAAPVQIEPPRVALPHAGPPGQAPRRRAPRKCSHTGVAPTSR